MCTKFTIFWFFFLFAESYLSFIRVVESVESQASRVFAESEFDYAGYHSLPDECITSVENFFVMFVKRWDDGEGDMKDIVERAITYLKTLKEPIIE